MKKIIVLILLIFTGLIEAQFQTDLTRIINGQTQYWNGATWTAIPTSLTGGGWTLGTNKVYPTTAGSAVHFRINAGDTTGTSLFNFYGTSWFKYQSTIDSLSTAEFDLVDSAKAINLTGSNYMRKTSVVGIDPNINEQITNGTFETNTTGWKARGNHAIVRITSDKHSGSASGQITSTGAGSTSNGVGVAVSLTAGYKYTTQFWAKSVSGNTALTVTTADGQIVLVSTITTSWAKYVVNSAVTATSSDSLHFYLGDTGVFLLDDVSFTHALDFVWIMTFKTTMSNYGTISEYTNASVNKTVQSQLQTNHKLRLSIYDGTNTNNISTTSTSMNDGNWHLAVFVAPRNGTATLFIDGTSQGTGSMSSIGNLTVTSPVYTIGSRANDYSGKFTGQVGTNQLILFNSLPSNITSIVGNISSNWKRKGLPNYYSTGTFAVNYRFSGNDTTHIFQDYSVNNNTLNGQGVTVTSQTSTLGSVDKDYTRGNDGYRTIYTPMRFKDTTFVDGKVVSAYPPKVQTAIGRNLSITDTARIKISSAIGGVAKAWFLLAPPRATCIITVDRKVRYIGKVGNLFMSRASEIKYVTSAKNCFTSRYFSVTYSNRANGGTFGHNAYFDIPFHDSINIKIYYSIPWKLYYSIYYEIGRDNVGRYPEFYAYTRDSVRSDITVTDTLINLVNVGRGMYRSIYFWVLGDSVNARNYLVRAFHSIQDGNNVQLSTGGEDYPGYYYYYASVDSMYNKTSDFHGTPVSGLRNDNHYLDCFYRIHDLEKMTFDNNYQIYLETATEEAASRYSHLGYCIIYYLEKPQ